MDVPAPDPFDQLLVHRAWLERVAREMVRDEFEAQDVAQEVWLKAIRRPPADGRSPRGWLKTVLRHVAIDRWRRRRRDPTSVADIEGQTLLPDPHDLAVQAEAQGHVTRAVLALDEPYRSTVLLRYVGNHSLDQIARELGVSLETIRSRLKRARARLRVRLDAHDDREGGSWRAALAPLVGTLPATLAAGAGAATSATATLAVAGVAAAALAGIGVWAFGGASQPAPDPGHAAPIGAAVDSGNPEPADADADAEAVLVGRTPAPRPTVAAEAGVVQGWVGTSNRRPLRDAQVALWMRRPGMLHASRVAAVTPGSDGAFAFRDVSGEAREYEVRAHAAGCLERRRTVWPGAEPVDIQLAPATFVAGRLVPDVPGMPVAGVPIGVRRAGRAPGRRERVVHTDARGRFRVDGLPDGRWIVRNVRARQEDPASAGVDLVPMQVAGVLSGTADVRLVARRGAEIQGRVQDDDQTPMEAMDVVLHGPLEAPPGTPRLALRVRTDERGRFLFRGLPAGRYRVQAGAGAEAEDQGSGYFPSTARDVAHGSRDVALQVSRAGTVEGWIWSLDGDALPAGVPVVAWAPDAPADAPGRRVEGRADAQGRFRLTGLGPHAFRIQAGGADCGVRPADAAPGIRPGARGVQLAVISGVSLHAELPASHAGARVEVRVPEAAHGLVWRGAVASDGRVHVSGVPPGPVALRLVTGDGDIVEVGTFEAPGDLGRVTMPSER